MRHHTIADYRHLLYRNNQIIIDRLRTENTRLRAENERLRRNLQAIAGGGG